MVDAIGERRHLVVVGQSLGGFTAPLVCDQVAADLLVLARADDPRAGRLARVVSGRAPGMTMKGASTTTDPIELFYHDVPRDLAAEALSKGRNQSEGAHGRRVAAGPRGRTSRRACCSVATTTFSRRASYRRVARERLGLTPDEIDGGHCPALSRPKELADRLESYTAP